VAVDPLTRLRLAGLAGAVALALGAVGAGVWPTPPWDLPLPGVSLLRSGNWPGVVLAAVGMALMAGAWWRAGFRPEGPPPVRWAVVTVALWAVPLLLAPPLFSRDLYSYAAQGDVVAHGLDPYTYGPAALPSDWLQSVSTTWWNTPAPYGPLFLVLARVAAELSGGHLWVALLVLRLVAVAGVVLLATTLPTLARRCGVDERRAVWLGLASPLLLVHSVSGGHNDALMLGLLVAGLAAATSARGVPAVVLVTLAAMVKAPAALALPFVALLWVPRQWALLRTAAVAAVVVTAVGSATGLWFGWIGALGTPGYTVQWTSLPTGLGLAVGSALEVLGVGTFEGAVTVARALGSVAAVVVAAVLWWRVRTEDASPRRVVTACAWAFAAVVVLAPAFHPWYAVWALVPLAASTVDRRVPGWIGGLTAGLCFLVLPNGYNLARATTVPGVLFDVALTAFAVVLAVRWWRSREPVGAGA
jgi:hypothetical protein